jgi:hypothetical protein
MLGAAGYTFDKAPIPTKHEMVVSKGEQWLIRTQDVNDFRAMGMETVGIVAAKAQRRAFENQALSALLLYTRGALKEDLSDRVVYQLAGLESLLISGGQEQLTQNLRERLAFFLEKTFEGRTEVIEAVNKMYELRSGFVHHGQPIEDQEVFNRFAQFGWRFFIKLCDNLHFPTQEHFIKAVEHIKLSGENPSTAAEQQRQAPSDSSSEASSLLARVQQQSTTTRELRFKQTPLGAEIAAKVDGARAAMHVGIETAERIEKPFVTISDRWAVGDGKLGRGPKGQQIHCIVVEGLRARSAARGDGLFRDAASCHQGDSPESG